MNEASAKPCLLTEFKSTIKLNKGQFKVILYHTIPIEKNFAG